MPLLMSPVSTAAFDGAERPHPVDRPHVEAVPAFGGLAGVGHPEGGAVDGGLDVVDADGVAGQHRLHVALADEPLEIGPRAGVHQRRPDHPEQVAAALPFLAQAGGEFLVVDRALAAHLGGHEAELVGAVRARQEAGGVHEHALRPVLGLPHHDLLAGLEPARFDDLQRLPAPHDHAVHARAAGHDPPPPAEVHVGREVRGGEEALGEHAVGGERGKAGRGSAGKGRLPEIGRGISWRSHRSGNLRGGREGIQGGPT